MITTIKHTKIEQTIQDFGQEISLEILIIYVRVLVIF